MESIMAPEEIKIWISGSEAEGEPVDEDHIPEVLPESGKSLWSILARVNAQLFDSARKLKVTNADVKSF